MTPAASDSEHRRRYLASHDFACPGCGYNLRGLTGDTCPECRQLLEQIKLAKPRTGRLIAARTPLALGAGTAAVLLSAFVLFGILTYTLDDGAPYILILASWLTAQAVPLALLAARPGRAWFAWRTDHQQALIIAISWLVTLGGAVGFMCFFAL